MGHALPLDLDRLLGGASPVKAVQPIDSGAVHCDGIVDIARLIPRAAPQREKARRSILVDRARA